MTLAKITLAEISELFIRGKGDTEIAQIMVDSGQAQSLENTRKSVGFLRKILEGGNSSEAMVLTRQNLDKAGNVTGEVYSRRAINTAVPDNLKLKGISKSPSGGQWEIYRADDGDTGAILKEELLKAVQPLSLKYTDKITGELALEIMLTDHHFGKVPFSYKAEDWTLENAKREFEQAINHHLSLVPVKQVSTIIFPVGNDLLHINSNTGTTKRGTAMEYSDNYHRLYSFVRDVIAGAVLSLSKDFNVIVPIIPGNHDEDACYRLGDYLEGLFDGSDRVTINNSGHDRKYVAWGNTLIMFCHGEKIKIEKLHDSFGVDVPQMNALAKFRHGHIGHLHKEKKVETWRANVRDEYLGTDIEVCPSLSPTDNWHFDNMYVGNKRRSKSYLYHLEKGKIQEGYYTCA